MNRSGQNSPTLNTPMPMFCNIGPPPDFVISKTKEESIALDYATARPWNAQRTFRETIL
jgi:hypothetical protein